MVSLLLKMGGVIKLIMELKIMETKKLDLNQKIRQFGQSLQIRLSIFLYYNERSEYFDNSRTLLGTKFK